MSQLIIPTVHLNGTSRQALVDGYNEACTALQGALGALQDAEPNARDYYPQGDGVFAAARAQHAERIAVVRKVFDELQTIYDALVQAK